MILKDIRIRCCNRQDCRSEARYSGESENLPAYLDAHGWRKLVADKYVCSLVCSLQISEHAA